MDDYDNLDRQSATITIDGWFTPSMEKPLPQVIKGVVLDCKRRKNPRRNQNEEYLLIELAEPVEGLVMQDGEEGTEGTLEKGMVIGIDLRQALQSLREHRGPAKIVFLERMEVDDRNWWKTDVFFNKEKVSGRSETPATTSKHTTRKVNAADVFFNKEKVSGRSETPATTSKHTTRKVNADGTDRGDDDIPF